MRAKKPDSDYVVRLERQGGPDVLEVVPAAIEDPVDGQVLLRNLAVGFNFIDISQRDGRAGLTLPSGLGHEGVGIVEAIGRGVTDLSVGDRVAYINAGIGAYSTRRIVPADRLIKVPDDIETDVLAASLFKGLTAQYLVKRTFKVGPGNLVIVHAAAGGVGSILSGWARLLGATVVGTVGTEEKRAAALAAGCASVVNYSDDRWVEHLLDQTGGRKAEVVFDSVGQRTVFGSIDALAPFGLLVIFGMASGPAPPIDPELLNAKGCLYMTRPSVFAHNSTTERLRENAADLFQTMRQPDFLMPVVKKFPLTRIANVHRAVEARQVTGSIVLIP